MAENLINDIVSMMTEPSRKATLSGPEKSLIEEVLSTLHESPDKNEVSVLGKQQTLASEPKDAQKSLPVARKHSAARMPTLELHYQRVRFGTCTKQQKVQISVHLLGHPRLIYLPQFHAHGGAHTRVRNFKQYFLSIAFSRHVCNFAGWTLATV